jgi:hypothetical protein
VEERTLLLGSDPAAQKQEAWYYNKQARAGCWAAPSCAWDPS